MKKNRLLLFVTGKIQNDACLASLRVVPILAISLMLSGCAVGAYSASTNLSAAVSLPSEIFKQLPLLAINDSYIKDGVIALEDENYIDATSFFNKALKFDPQNPHLHFLNALSYHLRAIAGDTSQYEFAETGYRLVLRFDPSNYWAAYHLGHIQLHFKQYRQAQETFSYALLLSPKSSDAMLALLNASYYSNDRKTTAGIMALLDKTSPNNPDFLESKPVVLASLGLLEMAEAAFDEYRLSPHVNSFQETRILSRLGDLRFASEGYGTPAFNLKINTALEDIETDQGEGLTPGDSDDSDDSDDDESSDDGDTDDSADQQPPRMALIDVAIIASSEIVATNRGVNLLNGLSLILTGTPYAYSRSQDTHNFDRGWYWDGDEKKWTRQDDPENIDAIGTALTGAITNDFSLAFPSDGIAYVLNIFNDEQDKNEVIARPSLLVLDGESSEFFSGAVLHVQLVHQTGTDQGEISEVPVGVELRVKPEFLSDTMIKMEVNVARAFLQNASPNVRMDNFTQTSKTEVSSHAVLSFGETMVISGLTEEEKEDGKTGVPWLQDVPIVKYLFSEQTITDYKKSVLVILTPKSPQMTDQDGNLVAKTTSKGVERASGPNLSLVNKRLQLREELEYALSKQQLQSPEQVLLTRPRIGDLPFNKWNEKQQVNEAISTTLQYHYL